MKIEEVKKFFRENTDKIPLSFSDLVYKINDERVKSPKNIKSEKYKDDDYSVFKFYKPISRLK